MELQGVIREIGERSKNASRELAKISSSQKNEALFLLAKMLETKKQDIFDANRKDLEMAEKNGLDAARIERLRITEKTISDMATACKEVAGFDDPVGKIEDMVVRPSGIRVGKMRIPLGVIAIIYESRPNVTIDAAILCLKAGNAVILRGGSEAFYSNQILCFLIAQSLKKAGLPEDGVISLPTTDREAVNYLLELEEFIDVVIPRGGEGLIRAVVKKAKMPVLKHYKGVCHIYVDKYADLDMSLDIVYNAKVQRPGVCNAMECLLVHKDIAEIFLPKVEEKLGKAGVIFHACPKSKNIFQKSELATEEDWGKEYLSLDLAVKIVSSMQEAFKHIEKYGSNHSEAILTKDYFRAMRFLKEVDASAVFVNASTRFNDGGEFGLGAEIGISTSKLHAYGPMGIKELTTTKFVVLGEGQIRT
ncbi:glutamate-5-semialdehyde dehydrogenase [Desulfonauticus submarinus]|uniref:Gamma-glutamyl phosphate reductase n=1 Tax=Desulfonauticus submarinus TaxID=206665 RepID=A0A1H0AM68_9BACT|nr:glutamate-5-semialdehyde dehydrogenase [Desulfonauticus submarinus]SDN34630.1 glutamate-5-semialdehyde dehydrogenase [Desulfonauticus submarinus]